MFSPFEAEYNNNPTINNKYASNDKDNNNARAKTNVDFFLKSNSFKDNKQMHKNPKYPGSTQNPVNLFKYVRESTYK